MPDVYLPMQDGSTKACYMFISCYRGPYLNLTLLGNGQSLPIRDYDITTVSTKKSMPQVSSGTALSFSLSNFNKTLTEESEVNWRFTGEEVPEVPTNSSATRNSMRRAAIAPAPECELLKNTNVIFRPHILYFLHDDYQFSITEIPLL
jgi:hypothetical protein